MELRSLTILVIMLSFQLNLYAQSTISQNITYDPTHRGVNGYIYSMKVNFKFLRCIDHLQLGYQADYSSRTASEYVYKGKNYSLSAIGGKFNASQISGGLDVLVDVIYYPPNSSQPTVLVKDLEIKGVNNFAAGCAANAETLIGRISDHKFFFDKLHRLKLRNIRVTEGRSTDYKIEKLIKERQRTEEYDKYMRYGKVYMNSRKWDQALEAFQKARPIAADKTEVDEKIAEVKAKIEGEKKEKEEAENAQATAVNSASESQQSSHGSQESQGSQSVENSFSNNVPNPPLDAKSAQEIKNQQILEAHNKWQKEFRERDERISREFREEWNTKVDYVMKGFQYDNAREELLTLSSKGKSPQQLRSEVERKKRELERLSRQRQQEINQEMQRQHQRQQYSNSYNQAIGQSVTNAMKVVNHAVMQSELKKARQKLEDELESELRRELNKLTDENDRQAEKFRRAAASATHPEHEKYYDKVADYYDNCSASQKSNFSTKYFGWVSCGYSLPTKPYSTSRLSNSALLKYAINKYNSSKNGSKYSIQESEASEKILNAILSEDRNNAEANYYKSLLVESEYDILSFLHVSKALSIEKTNTTYKSKLSSIKRSIERLLANEIADDNTSCLKALNKYNIVPLFDLPNDNGLLEYIIRQDARECLEYSLNKISHYSSQKGSLKNELLTEAIKHDALKCLYSVEGKDISNLNCFATRERYAMALHHRSKDIAKHYLTNRTCFNKEHLLEAIAQNKVNSRDVVYKSLVESAIELDHADYLKAALSIDSNAYSSYINGRSTLDNIVKKEKDNLFNAFLNHSAKYPLSKERYQELVMILLNNGNNRYMERMLSRIDISMPKIGDDIQLKLLEKSIQTDNVSALKKFEKLNFNLSLKCEDGNSLAQFAAIRSSSDVLSYLIESKRGSLRSQ